MALRQLVFSSSHSTQVQQPKKSIAHRRSFGKLPRLSKELMYESVQNQPLPYSPLNSPSLPRTSFTAPTPTDVSSPLNESPSTDGSGSPTPRPSRSATMSNGDAYSHSVDGQSHTMSQSVKAGHDDEDPSMWMSVFNKAKRGSRVFHREGEDIIDDLATVKRRQSSGRKLFKSSPNSPVEATFPDMPTRADQDERTNRRASIFDNFSLPSFHPSRFSNKRNSVATVSSQGDDLLTTPESSVNNSPYTPSSEFGLPRDPFGKYSGPTIIGGDHHEHAHEAGPGAAKKADDLSNQQWWNESTSTDLRRNATVPRWVHASPPPSPPQTESVSPLENKGKSRELSPQRTSASYYVPVLGLHFPLPPSCTSDEVADMSGRGITVKEFQSSILARHDIHAIDFAYDPSLAIYRSATVGDPFAAFPRLPPGIYVTKNFDPYHRVRRSPVRRDNQHQALYDAFDSLLLGSPSTRKASKSVNHARTTPKTPQHTTKASISSIESSDTGANTVKRAKRKSFSEAFAHGGAFFGRLTHA